MVYWNSFDDTDNSLVHLANKTILNDNAVQPVKKARNLGKRPWVLSFC